MTRIETDVLIVGAGIAGLVAALSTRARRVCILSPDGIEGGGAASDCALGGLAAAVDANDSPALHLEDTLRAGGSLNSVSAAHLACCEGPLAVEYLKLLGVPFARVDGRWSLRREAAHGRARVLHAGDRTGATIMRTLRQRLADARHVEVFTRAMATRLLLDSDGVCGIVAQDRDGRCFPMFARDVVVATGGVGGLFSRSTNPLGSCGDGPAMALAAGARCASLEFVQFHPTALDVDDRPLPLLTEALRGAGARLVDDAGARIMRDVHPLADLAPRDVVARAIYSAQRAGRRAWLDATRLADADFAAHFPAAYALCRAHGIDPRRQPIPITPAAHYHMGGIAVDLEGRTSLPRLWAVGEAACTGMHGANRLASNSLLEAVVYGRRLGRALGLEPSEPHGTAPMVCEDSAPPDPASEHELRQLMWRCMGIVRDAALLARGLDGIAQLRGRLPVHATLTRSRLLLAEHMLLAASRRRVSCGAHYRGDTGTARIQPRAAPASDCRVDS